MAQSPKDVLAAGAVVIRSGKKGKQVLLVHRPRYDDWSFPKGKLDRGEHPTAAAVREVGEETGVHVRLGVPLRSQRYQTSRGLKTVFYWAGHAVGDDDVSSYAVNDEIDEVAWVDVPEARDRLTYDYDRSTFTEARSVPRKTQALVVLRHAQAYQRKYWRRDDRLRPLLRAGRLHAAAAVPVLSAYDVSHVVSSSSTRCVQTVTPYAEASGWDLRLTDDLSEEDATASSVRAVVEELLRAGAGALLCTHRPVLPSVFDALALEPVRLPPGGLVVAHHRKGRVVATETHFG